MTKKTEHPSDKDKKKSVEQQLAAANQQLRASEQQLKAANQQLKAGYHQLKAAEEELRKSRLQYEKMFDGTINAIAVYDAVDNGNDFICKNFNSAAEKLEKIKKSDLLDKKILDVMPSVKELGLFDIIQKVWKSGKPEHFMQTIHEQGKITGWRENYVYKLPSAEIVVVYQDITERRRAEEILAEEYLLLRTLIDNIPDSIYVKDTKSRFIIGNTEVAHRAGVASPDELTGKTDFDFHPQELASKYYAAEQEILRSGQPLINREEYIINRTTGETIWNLTTKVPWRDSHGKIVGIMGINHNITEQKQMKEALKAANQQLEAMNQQLRASEQQLRASNQQLEAINQQLRASEQQLEAANQQLRASEQQLKATNQQLQASEEELRRLNLALHKHLRELDCLYSLSRLDERHVSLEQVLKKLVNMIPSAWEYPDIAAARITFEDRQLQTSNFLETPWMQSADIKIHDRKIGAINVCYLEEKPDVDEGPFFMEERNLLDALAEHIGDIIDHRRDKEKLLDYQAQLKSLASELSLTEERERRRIATELHDRISQFLVISKVRLEALRESAVSEDFAKSLREICNSLDQVIQNTRSLTFDLSSPILYELGFEAAVAEWFDEQFKAKHDISTEFEDDGLPKPLNDDIRVLLFRDVRELLINVIKHANAHKVKVSIHKAGENIKVIVEDNGAGFDISEITSIATKTGGFGLFSIRERLKQLGGHLEIISKPGRGTKVTLTAPLKQEGDANDKKR